MFGTLIGVALFLGIPVTQAMIVLEQSAKLVLSDPNYTTVSRVAVDGNVAIVSSTRAFDSTAQWGNAVFLYERSGSSWVFRTKLLDERRPLSEGRPIASVAVQGTVVAVAGARPQTLFVFERVGTTTTWSLTATLGRPSGVANLGRDVEIDSGTIFVSAATGSYQGVTYRKNASGQWTSVGTVTAQSANRAGSAGGDVDIAGTRLAVASPYGCPGCTPVPGQVTLFAGAPGAWSPFHVVSEPTNDNPTLFASTIAMDQVALMAAVNLNRGIYVFPEENNFIVDRVFQPVDSFMLGSPNTKGAVMATDGGVAVFGAPDDDTRGSNAGSALIYLTGVSDPVQNIVRLYASDPSSNLRLGSSVEISGLRVIAGTAKNAAYIFDLPNPIRPVPEDPPVLQETFEFDNGGNFTPIAGSSFSVVSNGTTRVFRQSSLTGNAGALLANSTRTNQGIQADVRPTAFDGADRWFGLVVRYTDQNNFYYVTMRSSNVVQLRKVVGGTQTTLASASFTVALNRNYRLRLEAIGRFLQVYVNGVPVLRARDTSLKEGLAGLWMFKARADYDNVVVSPNPALTLFADSFEASNAAQWTPFGVGSWSVVTDGSKVYRQDSLAGTALSVTGSGGSINASIRVRAKALAFDGTDRWFGIIIKFVDAQTYTYITVRNTNTVQLREVINGQVNLLDSAPLTVTTGTWYDLRLESVGNFFRGYVNGRLLLERTLGTSTGRYGIITHRTRAEFDDFIATLH
jgi:hypothetical protein